MRTLTDDSSASDAVQVGFAALATMLVIIVSVLLFVSHGNARRRSNGNASTPVPSTPEDEDFGQACKHVNSIRDQLPMKERLRLYSYFKQGLCGDAPTQGPPPYMVLDHTKWSSWARRRGLPERVAKAKYVSIVHELGQRAHPGPMAAVASSAGATPQDHTPSAVAERAESPAAAEASALAKAPHGPPTSAILATDSALRARIVQLEATVAQLTRQTMRGWLYRYRPDAASWLSSSASRWDRRFFVLTREAQGSLQLHYYPTETALVPDERLPLANCVVVDEGVKSSKRVTYRIFSVWLVGTLHSERGPGSGALLRASCADEPDIQRWLEALAEATGLPVRTLESIGQSPPPPVRRALHTSEAAEGGDGAVGVGPAATTGAALAADPKAPSSAAGVHAPAAGATHAPTLSALSALEIRGDADALRPRPPPLLEEARARPPGVELPGGPHGSGAAAPPSTPGTEPPTTPGGSRKPRAPLDPNLFPASRPMHRVAKASLLSGGTAMGDGRGEPANLAGFVNLVFLLFVLTNCRLLLENLLSNGLLISLPRPASTLGDAAASDVRLGETPARLLRTAAVLLAPILCAHGLECAAVRRTPFSRFSRRFVDPLHVLNAAAAVVLPSALVFAERHYGGGGGGVLLLICSVTVFLKLVSWAHVHHDLRAADAESRDDAEGSLDARLAKFRSTVSDTDGDHLHYPNNVRLANLVWFVVAPTLCYQLDYPRTPRVRKTYLVSLVVRSAVLWTLLPAFCVQTITPLLEQSLEPLEQGDLPRILERTLRLAVPVTYAWLLGFYAFFHVWLNLLAELTRFGDRVFYKAWWNATDFEGYWRMWNMPVHMWVVRHAFFPIQRHVTSSKVLTGLLCFTLSAVLHEVVVAFPLHSYYMPLAFVGMMSQVPLLPLSSLLKQRTRGTAFEQAGNYLFWVTFCFVGQPLCVLLYYAHVMRLHRE